MLCPANGHSCLLTIAQVIWCVVISFIFSVLLLGVSITTWCEHGSLMTSSASWMCTTLFPVGKAHSMSQLRLHLLVFQVMLAYNVYLCHQVAEIRPDSAAPLEDDDVPTTLCSSSNALAQWQGSFIQDARLQETCSEVWPAGAGLFPCLLRH